MSGIDKVKDKAQELRGRAEEQAGRATGDAGLEAQGTGDRVAGDLKQAGEKVKDVFR